MCAQVHRLCVRALRQHTLCSVRIPCEKDLWSGKAPTDVTDDDADEEVNDESKGENLGGAMP